MLESLFNKVAGLKACNFIKKRSQDRCFPVDFAKLLRNLFYKTPPDDCFSEFKESLDAASLLTLFIDETVV